jgi:hypothetical protein
LEIENVMHVKVFHLLFFGGGEWMQWLHPRMILALQK